MGVLKFIWDFLRYPFDMDNDRNRFSNFIKTFFKDYPAFLWIKPNIKKIIIAPFLVIYNLFKRD